MLGGTIILGAGALVHRRGTLLVVRRALEPDKGLWAFPGGRVEVGETPSETAVREVKEEVGLDIELEGLFEVVTYLPKDMKESPGQVVIVDYLAKPVGGRVVLNSESSDYRWAMPDEISRLPTTTQMKACAKKFKALGL